MLLVEHDANNYAGDQRYRSHEEQEEDLDPGHGRRLCILDVVSRRLEECGRRKDVRPIPLVQNLENKHQIITIDTRYAEEKI